jgi:hypothetical protein
MQGVMAALEHRYSFERPARIGVTVFYQLERIFELQNSDQLTSVFFFLQRLQRLNGPSPSSRMNSETGWSFRHCLQ